MGEATVKSRTLSDLNHPALLKFMVGYFNKEKRIKMAGATGYLALMWWEQ